MPLIQKAYQASVPAGSDANPDMGPTVSEVD
jgi:hypothetical protein